MKFGIDKIKLGNEFDLYYEKWNAGEITLKEGAEGLGTSLSTFYRRCIEKRNSEMKE